MERISQSRKKLYKRWIVVFSVVIPLLVAALFGIKIDGYDLSFLPPIYASINGLTAVGLMVAFWAIKRGKVKLHRGMIILCLLFSVAFLGMYVAYHITSESTSFGGEGIIKVIYLVILVSHILLSIAVVPLVLFTLLRALTMEFKRHRIMARITFPIWLYVAVSGVIVYLMISPYY